MSKISNVSFFNKISKRKLLENLKAKAKNLWKNSDETKEGDGNTFLKTRNYNIKNRMEKPWEYNENETFWKYDFWKILTQRKIPSVYIFNSSNFSFTEVSFKGRHKLGKPASQLTNHSERFQVQPTTDYYQKFVWHPNHRTEASNIEN